ncbi:MAG TPA: hypothetical protein VGI75_01240, partial [Pirellulales bacterium]
MSLNCRFFALVGGHLIKKLGYIRFLIFATFWTLLLIGCGTDRPAEHSEQQPSLPDKIRLAIVDDPSLAASVELLRGEWKAQSGSDLEIVSIDSDVEHRQQIDADAVIYPTALLGKLAEHRLIRPFGKSWLQNDSLDAIDLLEPPDALEFSWDGQPDAVSLGQPTFVLFYRADLFERFHKQPPRTWDEYQALVQFFSDPKNLKDVTGINAANWRATSEPVGTLWAAR